MLVQISLISQILMLIDPNDTVLTQKALFSFKCIFEPLGLQRVLYHLKGDRKSGVTSLLTTPNQYLQQHTAITHQDLQQHLKNVLQFMRWSRFQMILEHEHIVRYIFIEQKYRQGSAQQHFFSAEITLDLYICICYFYLTLNIFSPK